MKAIKVLLQFPVEETNTPVTWMFATEYGIRFSILQADVRPAQGGRLILDLSGEEESLAAALDFARSVGVTVKVLSKSVEWDEDRCVHCGACTAACPTKALTMDFDTAELCFDNEKCVVCETCTRVCTTGAMKLALF